MGTVTQGNGTTVTLPPGHALSVIADVSSSGRVWPFGERLGDTPGIYEVAADSTVLIGPFAAVTRYQIDAITGFLTYGESVVDFPTLSEAVAASGLAAAGQHLTVIDPNEAIADVVEIIGTGAPAASAQATATLNPAGDDNALTFTAVAFGEAGNAISIAYLDPGAADAVLSVSVTGTAIAVSLATDSEEAITSTAAEVLAAIEAFAEADALVTVAIDASDTGVADDGSGVVTALAAALLEGGDGVGVGVAGPGSRYTDTNGPALYLNTGTKAQPVWTELTLAS